jgi:formylglycine-generating enzyme required for sulfatase activity
MLALSIGAAATAAYGNTLEKFVDLDCGCGVTMRLVLIPPGEFMMGGEEQPEEVARKCVGGPPMPVFVGKLSQSFLNEQPRHLVKINMPFYMGIYCVTQEQYHAVVGEQPVKFEGPTRPMEMVSWYGATRFCKALSEKTGKRVCLPTEAEWEYACRAGTTTAFNTGETISTNEANYNGTGAYGTGKVGTNRQMTTPVGSFPPNAWGLYDMHGNLWQWCSSLYKAYPYNSRDGREDEIASGDRVLRGGSWVHAPFNARSAKRLGQSPLSQLRDYGFRVVMTAGENSPETSERRETSAPQVVSQETIGARGSGLCALLNALKFGGDAERAAAVGIPGQDDPARVRSLIAAYGNKPSEIYPDRKRFEADRGCDVHELLEIALDASRSLGLKTVSGKWFDRAKEENSADLVRRIRGLLRASLDDGFPPIVLMGSYLPANSPSNPLGWSWTRAGEQWACILGLPEKLKSGALGFEFRFADSFTGKIQDGYCYSQSRSFSGRKGDDRGGYWVPRRPFLIAVTPSLPLGLDKTPWFLRTEVALEYGLIRKPTKPPRDALPAASAQNEPAEPTVVRQHVKGQGLDRACGPCALLNALKFGGPAERAAAARIPGSGDFARVRNLIATYRSQQAVKKGPPNPAYKCDADGSCALGALSKMTWDTLGLRTVNCPNLDRANDERPVDYVHRVYIWIERSLEDGFPPVVDIHKFAVQDEPAKPDGRSWKNSYGHFVCIVGLPEKLGPEALGFSFLFADAGDGRVEEGYFYADRYRNFGDLADYGPLFPRMIWPVEGENSGEKLWFQRDTIAMGGLIIRQPAMPANAP